MTRLIRRPSGRQPGDSINRLNRSGPHLPADLDSHPSMKTASRMSTNLTYATSMSTVGVISPPLILRCPEGTLGPIPCSLIEGAASDVLQHAIAAKSPSEGAAVEINVRGGQVGVCCLPYAKDSSD